MSKIVQLTASNVKRLSAVSITPDGSTVVIGGRHGNGKSSVLDCIVYAITGTKSLPPVPLRRGASKGHIDLDLGDLRIRRTFTRKGEADYSTSLKVTRANGDEVRGAQGVLDSLCSSLAFDPLEFARLKPKAQLEALKTLVQLDFADLDREREATYQRRTEVNRQATAKRGELEAMPVIAGVPEDEVSVSERLTAVQTATKANQSIVDARKLLSMKEANLRVKRAEAKRLEDALTVALNEADALEKAAEQQQAVVDALPPPVDVEALQRELSEAEAINQKVRHNQKRAGAAAILKAFTEQSEALTRKIDSIDDQKSAAMKSAKFPVDGLGFGSDGVLLNGLPLEQANTAAQIELSVAMGLALNPTLRVMLVRDGSSLFADETGLGLIAKLAEKHDAQVWIERASVGEECSVIIDDGHVQDQLAMDVPEMMQERDNLSDELTDVIG